MARGDHWWNEPPVWAWVTMVASLVAIIVLLPIALNRTAPTSGSSDGQHGAPVDATGPPPAETSGATPSDDEGVTRILVIGDSYTGGSPEGGQGEAGWPALLEQRMPDIQVEVAATGDAGYVTTAGDPTLPDLVAEADLTDVDLVVLFGSRFDAAGIADRVGAAAGESIASVRDRAADATLVVLGPAWPDAAPPAGVRNNRDAIRAAAEAASTPFVDPLREEWFADDRGLIGADGVHPTDEGHARLADRIQPVVQDALEGRSAVPATSGG
jgi:lysophospholipase L1-like esterase